MKKSDYENKNFSELEEEIRSYSKYHLSEGYEIKISQPGNRTNPKSRIPGGSVVYLVDRKSKREMAYPNIKNTSIYVSTILDEFKPETNFVKQIDEVYILSADNKIKQIPFTKK